MIVSPALDRYSVKDSEGRLLEPGTYFVIRSSDLFASVGLFAYAHSMETVLEFAEQCDQQQRCGNHMPRLRELADRAVALADTWQRSGMGRIPS